MRILIVSGIFPPNIGGPAKFTRESAFFLHEKGFHVTVLTLGQREDLVPPNVFEVIRIPRGKNVYIRMLLTLAAIIRELKKADAVLVNGLYIETAIGLTFYKRKSICKIVGDPIWEYAKVSRRFSGSIESFQNHHLKPKLRLMRFLYTTSFKKFDYITSPGLDLVEIIKKWDDNFSPIHIPNGTKCIKVESHPTSFDIVSLSRLVPWKNIDILIKICAELDLSLAIGGSGPEEKYLKDVSAEVKGRTEFTGEIESAKTLEYLAKGRCFALVSNYEGMSFTLIEAMMLGKVVIVSDIKANTDVIQDGYNGIVIDLLDREGSVAKIKNMFNDQEFQNKISINAHVTAIEKYCAEKQFNRYIDLLA